MEAKSRLEEKLEYLRSEWVKATPEERTRIEQQAREIRQQMNNKMTSDEKIRAAQEKLRQWAEEYRQKQREFYLNRNGASTEPEEIFK